MLVETGHVDRVLFTVPARWLLRSPAVSSAESEARQRAVLHLLPVHCCECTAACIDRTQPAIRQTLKRPQLNTNTRHALLPDRASQSLQVGTCEPRIPCPCGRTWMCSHSVGSLNSCGLPTGKLRLQWFVEYVCLLITQIFASRFNSRSFCVSTHSFGMLLILAMLL